MGLGWFAFFTAVCLSWWVYDFIALKVIDSLSDNASKARWFNVKGVFLFLGLGIAAAACWLIWRSAAHAVFVIPGIWLMTLYWAIANHVGTYFCDNCNKRSVGGGLFPSEYHCPHCGHKLK